MRVFSGADIHRELQRVADNLEEARMRLLPTAKASGPLLAAQTQLQSLMKTVEDTPE